MNKQRPKTLCLPHFQILTVEPGKKYRFRLISNTVNCPQIFSIDDHKFTVIASDGWPIEPIEVRHSCTRADTVFIKPKNNRSTNTDAISFMGAVFWGFFFENCTSLGPMPKRQRRRNFKRPLETEPFAFFQRMATL